MAILAALGEPAAMVAGSSQGFDFASIAYSLLLAAPLVILAWMTRRYRDRRMIPLILFVTVLCLSAWGLSHLLDDVWRYHTDPDWRKVQRWTPITVLCGNWIALIAVWWTERLLKRLAKRGR